MAEILATPNAKRGSRKQLQTFFFVALMICLGAYSKIFIFIAVFLCFVIALLKDLVYTLEFLFFLLPMATVFKLGPEESSLFSYLMLFFVVKSLLLTKKYSGTIAGLLLMIAYLLFGNQLSALTQCKDILLCLLTCYLVMTGGIALDFEKVVSIFSIGVILSASVALIAENTPLFADLVTRISLMELHGEEVSRFRGLYTNSNYFTLDFTMLIACYMSLYCSKKSLSKEQWLMLVVLLVFGVLSGSFSFLLTTAVSMMAALMYMTRQNLLTMIRTTIVFMIVIGVVFLLMGDGAKMLISYRFESQMTNNDSLSNMTSGRSELQAIYLDYFKEHSTTVLLGDGLKAPNLGTMRRGPHNTFIDIIYYLGISGTIIYVGALISFMRVKVRFSQCKLYHWFPTASLLIRLMAISLLLLNNITFYYLLLWLALESRMRETTANPSPGSLAEVPGGRPIEKAPEGNLPRLKELKALE